MGKTLITGLLLLAVCLQVPAQPAVNKTELPHFTLQLTSGHFVSYKDLPRKKDLILIYFAPNCDHCREFIKRLVDKIDNFKHAQIVLISYFPLADLRKFGTEFGLDRLSNVMIGTEGNSFLVPAFFKIVNFPFTAVYNKSGRLIRVFREAPPLNLLADLLKK
ncbi:peroxiredoxin family protein [Sediminibacterium soli]|uniref:peroxiredoxin family protein n=1 Tax=Sediminibacterium soli TaxID=2698829 RepID=UPI0013799AD5|nr:redoxin domain-containing protein [Sediminibacterium soli]NCI47644.1 redoxin domain-containing protein [Sediminibacterium soli]